MEDEFFSSYENKRFEISFVLIDTLDRKKVFWEFWSFNVIICASIIYM